MMKNIQPWVFASLALTQVSCDQQEEKLPLPNILWIVSEDNSPFIGAYGDEFATTPVLDSLASKGTLYVNAFATSPVCAPARSTLITGMYANSMGTENMRSNYPIPEDFRFFPTYLREAGYYTTNNSKKDYNTLDQEEAWHESSKTATYLNRKPGQRFFHVQNIHVSHESSLHDSIPWEELIHDPEKVPIPDYHPKNDAMKHDWAQYYDKVQMMDAEVGKIIKELEESGLADSTIVFYYSDHGGVVGRSKRFIFESGLHVPFIISFPEMYRHLAPTSAGEKSGRLVSFVDFGPTVLSLAGIKVPENMQGKPFIGKYTSPEKDFTYGYRGRMDEKLDLVRSVRDKQYRYVRNYMPHKKYGQFIQYLWRAPSMRAWEQAYLQGELDETQSAFFNEKPAEELYDVTRDPDNVVNLAKVDEYKDILLKLRAEQERWIKEIKDVGFIPEPLVEEVSSEMPVYEYVRQEGFPYERIYETARMASSRDIAYADELLKRMDDPHPAIRYWAVTGAIILEMESPAVITVLKNRLEDEKAFIAAAAAEALHKSGVMEGVLEGLSYAMDSEYQMTRVYALNVLSQMGEDALPLKEKIGTLITGDPGTSVYDIREAMNIIENLE